jgi:hypothetical protein
MQTACQQRLGCSHGQHGQDCQQLAAAEQRYASQLQQSKAHDRLAYATAVAAAAAAVWQPCACKAALQACNAKGTRGMPASCVPAPRHLLHGKRGCSHSSRGVQLMPGELQQPAMRSAGQLRCRCTTVC